MIAQLCECRAVVMFSNRERGSECLCPSCNRPLKVPAQGLSDGELQKIVSSYRLQGTLSHRKSGANPGGSCHAATL